MPAGRRTNLRIGLLGLGTVGGGLVELVERHDAAIRRRLGFGLEIAGIAVRDPSRVRAVAPGRYPFRAAGELVSAPDVDAVVELIGGIEPARDLVLRAIAAGKDVVTANKALLAEEGEAVFGAAAARGVGVGFEASVAGGVPIIRALREVHAADRNRALYGIVNGTCNWILTAMSERGEELEQAVVEAQRLGIAEADPALDIDGVDAGHKLALLVGLAFATFCPASAVHVEGIRGLSQLDVAAARELGYAVKLLAIAKDDGRRVEARVHPTLIPLRSLLADVRDATNAITVQGEALGSTTYVGQGAGRLPTANSVLADLLEVARRRGAPAWPALGVPVERLRRRRLRDLGDLECEYYLRFLAIDRPGVLARITGILGRHRISLASVIQKDRGRGTSVPIVMRTHEARERNLRRAMDEIARLPVVRSRPAFLRIEENL